MRESLIEKKVCEKAKSLGWLVYKVTSPTTRGLPDRMFLRNSILFFIEFKRLDEQTRKFQNHIICKIKSKGFDVYVIDSIEKGYEVLTKYEKKF